MTKKETTSQEVPTATRLEALVQAVSRINTLQPPDDLLLRIAQEGSIALDAQRCTVWLLDEKTDELFTRVAMGLDGRQLRMPKHFGLAGDTLRTGQLSNVPDAAADPRFNAEVGQDERFRTVSLLSVPMKALDGRPIGVFQILNKKRDVGFTPQDEHLAEAFASAAAVVVLNSKQYQAVVRTRDQLDTENVQLRLNLSDSFSPAEIVGTSEGFKKVIETARRVSDTSVSIVITGESGTGKTLLAKCIHYNSQRRNKPFVDVNCAAIPETLLEAELFGIEKGVATGVDRRVGKLEAADGGTILLDEIGDMSLATQAKILRVVQDKAFERVGSQQTRRVDVRIISATNHDLKEAMVEKRFREDLYYRLNVVTLHLPPLRERREDIPALALRIVARLGARFGRSAKSFSPQALARLTSYDWPGNVRELENEIARSLILAIDRPQLGLEDLSERLQQTPVRLTRLGSVAGGTLADQVEALERRLLEETLAVEANRSKAAELLGLSREGLRKKLQRYGYEA